MSASPIPWTESLSPWRAPADVLLGCYPAFAFGGPLSRRIFPVFHFHEVSPSYLEPHLAYLAKNGYRCAGAGELMAYLEKGDRPPPRTVLLTFDDAWTSLWTVAAPLLRKYGMRAVTFAIPGRVSGSEGVRPTVGDEPGMEDFGDRGDEPFCRWEELKRLDQERVVEVEAHTFAHEQIPVTGEVSGKWTEAIVERIPLLSRPLVWTSPDAFRPYDRRELGLPLRPTRSRMSDARRLDAGNGAEETEDERRSAIAADLKRCYGQLASHLGRPPRLLCFPWAVAGAVATEEAARAGFRAAFSDSFPGRRFVHPRSNPFRLMRLKHNWIFALPGKGRRTVFGKVFRKRG